VYAPIQRGSFDKTSDVPREYNLNPKIEFVESSIEPESRASPTTTTTPLLHSRESSLAISQTPSQPPESHDATPTGDTVEQKPIVPRKHEFMSESPTRVKTLHPDLRETTPRSNRSSLALSHSRRSRSINTEITQETEEQPLSTVRIEHTPGPPGGMYPSPPPIHDPLGPAAQAPFLPAKSEYDGPDIYYSCRPGGPSTFDLLGTLPLEPFGVLDWDISEREEEIYESDDIRVEHKVMHALWLRWIMLNR
jgi:hypothetical protein